MKKSPVTTAIQRIRSELGLKYIGFMECKSDRLYLFNDPEHHASTLALTRDQLMDAEGTRDYVINKRNQFAA